MDEKDARSLSSEAQEALRKRAVKATESGMTQGAVAKAFGVHRGTVNKWVGKATKSGDAGLKARKRGRPPGHGSLEGWQAGNLVRMIKDKCPNQLKLPFFLWTREAVVLLALRKYSVTISLSTAGRYLRRWGFSPQKPVKRAYQQDPEAVQKWLDVEYPAIKKQAEAEGAHILWGDESGIRSDYQAGRSYGKVGETPVVSCPGSRFGCNMVSAISNRGLLAFMVFTGTFTSKVFLRFLRRLERKEKGRIFLIMDNHKVHHSREVTTWLTEPERMIKIFYLPTYSPDLNPDELLNNDVKQNAVGRKRAHSLEQLELNVRSHLKRRQANPSLVKRFFREKHVSYAA